MIKRLIVGLLLGAVLGAVAAAVLVQGLGVVSFEGHAVLPYLSAAAVGVLAGLVAGKPIWAADGRIEAGLKAFFGMLLALGGMFVLQRWVHVPVDLTALKAGEGTLGQLPAASLPLIGAILAGFFELDNSVGGDKEKDEAKGGTSAEKKLRVAASDAASDGEDDEAAEPAAAKKKR